MSGKDGTRDCAEAKEDTFEVRAARKKRRGTEVQQRKIENHLNRGCRC
jgi:hypothetical protein